MREIDAERQMCTTVQTSSSSRLNYTLVTPTICGGDAPFLPQPYAVRKHAEMWTDVSLDGLTYRPKLSIFEKMGLRLKDPFSSNWTLNLVVFNDGFSFIGKGFKIFIFEICFPKGN